MSPKQLYPRFINIWENVPKTTFRSSRPEVFSKKGVLRNFTKFIGKHVSQKRRLWYKYFSVNFVKFLRTHFFHRTLLVAASVCLASMLQIGLPLLNLLLLVAFLLSSSLRLSLTLSWSNNSLSREAIDPWVDSSSYNDSTILERKCRIIH